MLNDQLERLRRAAEAPEQEMEACRAAGKKLAGCIPEYVPEPLLHAAGYIPFGLWGGEGSIVQADRYMPTFACSLMRSCAERALAGGVRDLSFLVAPILCDALKGCVQTLRVAVPEPPVLPFSLPQNRTTPAAKAFLCGEYRALQKKIEDISGTEITEETLARSVRIYNRHREAMLAFDRTAADHTDVVTPYVREAVFRSAWSMEKAEHTAIVGTITEELKKRPVCRKNRVRLILTGVTGGSLTFMKLLGEEGIDVVGDHVYQDSWTYQHAIPEQGNDPIGALADHWLLMGGSCVTHESRRSRGRSVLALAGERQADAVVLCLMKFCDPEEYEAPLLLAEIKPHYPTLTLSIDQSAEDLEQLRTRVQTLKEMLC